MKNPDIRPENNLSVHPNTLKQRVSDFLSPKTFTPQRIRSGLKAAGIFLGIALPPTAAIAAFDALHIQTASAQQTNGHEFFLSSGMPSANEFNSKILLDGGPDDIVLPDGSRFSTKANGGAGPTKGYRIPPEMVKIIDQVGTDVLGAVEGQAFIDEVGRLAQPFQTGTPQINLQTGQVEWDNVIDRLVAQGKAPWLRAYKSIPEAADTGDDQGLTWGQIVERHNTLLDRYPALKKFYLSEANYMGRYGVPMGAESFEPMDVAVFNRGALQLWKVAQPWANPGDVTRVLAGQLAKEAGLYPVEVFTLEDLNNLRYAPLRLSPSGPTPVPTSRPTQAPTPSPTSEVPTEPIARVVYNSKVQLASMLDADINQIKQRSGGAAPVSRKTDGTLYCPHAEPNVPPAENLNGYQVGLYQTSNLYLLYEFRGYPPTGEAAYCGTGTWTPPPGFKLP